MLWKKREMTRGMLSLLGAAGLLLAAPHAKAACGLSVLGQGSAIKLPMLGQAESEAQGEWHGPADSIVGLWHVVYTTGGKVFNETLDQWHSDGTEFENAFLPPAVGNICFGVWKPAGYRSVKLHHIGWTFDGTGTTPANGTFTLDETNIVAKDGKTYSGRFTFKTFNLEGVQGADLTGTIAATRITVE
jgi:hypothetical protein